MGFFHLINDSWLRSAVIVPGIFYVDLRNDDEESDFYFFPSQACVKKPILLLKPCVRNAYGVVVSSRVFSYRAMNL